jgi:geranylgeranyl pyrophosphate synthase
MPNQPSMIKRDAHKTELLSPAEFRVLLDRAIKEVYAEWLPKANRVDETFAELLKEMASFIGRGGKRLRPYLCYLGYVGSGGRDIDEIIRVAVSQELYHNAWLIHDDIIDRDMTRYGGLNITGTYNKKFTESSVGDAMHLAEATALIAGNVNMALAVDAILQSSFLAELKVEAVRLQQELIVNLAGGELLDVLLPTLSESELTPKRLLAVSQFKTATYSFQSPLQIGAILAGATEAQVNAISPYAVASGVAFQLTDDVLGIFGENDKTGKSNLSDIREGKRTILVYEALLCASADDITTLNNVLGSSEATQADLIEVRAIMVRTGAFESAERRIAEYIDMAQRSLGATTLTVEVKSALAEIVTGLMGRES